MGAILTLIREHRDVLLDDLVGVMQATAIVLWSIVVVLWIAMERAHG